MELNNNKNYYNEKEREKEKKNDLNSVCRRNQFSLSLPPMHRCTPADTYSCAFIIYSCIVNRNETKRLLLLNLIRLYNDLKKVTMTYLKLVNRIYNEVNVLVKHDIFVLSCLQETNFIIYIHHSYGLIRSSNLFIYFLNSLFFLSEKITIRWIVNNQKVLLT